LKESLLNRLRQKLWSSLRAEFDQFEDNPASFIFSSDRPTYLNPPALNQRLDQEWKERRNLWESKETAPLQEIFFPRSPYTLKIIEQIYQLDYSLSIDQPSILLDLCVLQILKAIITDGHPPVSPQLFIELLNCYNERVPELLVLGNILFQMILKDHPTLKQEIKNRACAVLINHFEIEALFIFISGHPGLAEKDKQILFQSLTAFQKIYRKFLELQEEIGNKEAISQKWFGQGFDRLKNSPPFQDPFPILVNRFLNLAKEQKEAQALSLGRFLVLRFNNEDILRSLHALFPKEDMTTEAVLRKAAYRLIFSVMQDFRKEYIPQAVDSALTNTLSEMEAMAHHEEYPPITIGQLKQGIQLFPIQNALFPIMSQIGFTITNIIIWDKRNLFHNVGIFGFPSRFITLRTFEYIFIFQKQI